MTGNGAQVTTLDVTINVDRPADLGRDRSRVIAWPPGRNDPCWCGSRRKYKKCCGALGPDGSR